MDIKKGGTENRPTSAAQFAKNNALCLKSN
jgi:hypothetical protein